MGFKSPSSFSCAADDSLLLHQLGMFFAMSIARTLGTKTFIKAMDNHRLKRNTLWSSTNKTESPPQIAAMLCLSRLPLCDLPV